MKRLLTLFTGVVLFASAAHAQTGINFYLNDCSAGSDAHSVTNSCTKNTGNAMTLVGSVVLPAVTKPLFVAAGATIDVQSIQIALPDWWRGDACRADAFVCTGDSTVSPDCATLWDGYRSQVSSCTLQPFVGGPNRVRISCLTTLAAADAHDLVGDGVTELGVFRLTVSRAQSVGDGACAGCQWGACLSLREISLQGLNDDPGAYLRLTNPLSNSFVQYQVGTPTCYPTPTRNRSWGAIKAQYR